MSSREDILATIRRNTKQRYDYPVWEVEAITYADKIAKFCEVIRQVGGEAVLLGDGEDVSSVVRSRYPEATRIASSLENVACATFNPDDVEQAQDLDGTDIAIVKGAFAVAENGAVWIPQTVKHRALYFIAERLVIVVEREHILNNMHEAYHRLAAETYPFGTFISGPSKTADIEQALVMGAHGARDVLVVLT